MKLIYSQGFSKNERLEWRPVIFNNVVQSFRTISEAMSEIGIDYENPDNEVSYSEPETMISSSGELLSWAAEPQTRGCRRRGAQRTTKRCAE